MHVCLGGRGRGRKAAPAVSEQLKQDKVQRDLSE